jgi:Tol biopolymer transport system component
MILSKLSFTFAAVIGAGIVGALSLLLLVGAVVAGRFLLHSTEIAFVSYRDLNPDIYLTDLDHNLIYNLTRNEAYDIAPAWSPDGEWLAFASDREGRRNIYVMNHLGGSLRRLTNQGGIYTLPRWSTDGQSLVFVALDENPNGIYSIGLDGSNLERLNDPETPNRALTLDLALDPGSIARARSPDGSRIAFMTYREYGWGIYLSADATRRDASLLVTTGYPTEAPVWSPDGKQMAYIAQVSGSTDLFIIGVDDPRDPLRLTFNRSFESSPAWRP